MSVYLPAIKSFEGKKFKEEDVWDVDSDGHLIVDLKHYDKWFKHMSGDLKEWLKTDDALTIEQESRCAEFWDEECSGSIECWTFEALNYYPEKHELDTSNLKSLISYNGFEDFDYIPKVLETREYKGRKYPVYEKQTIAGTIIDKDKDTSSIVLLTNNGVANVRLGRKVFPALNKVESTGKGKDRIVTSPSWLERGTKLVIKGHRNQNDFYPDRRNGNIMLVSGGERAILLKDK